ASFRYPGLARRHDCEVRHIVAGLGAMPVHLACGNVDDVAGFDVAIASGVANGPLAFGDVEHLVGGVGVALGPGAVVEVDNVRPDLGGIGTDHGAHGHGAGEDGVVGGDFGGFAAADDVHARVVPRGPGVAKDGACLGSKA